MRFVLSCSTFVTAVLAVGRTEAPPGAITVGIGHKYSTIQAAIDSFDKASTADQSIFILPGTYTEKVIIPALDARLTIYGYTTDTSNYSSNVVTISHNLSTLTGAANDEESSTVDNRAARTNFYNINIKNTFGKGAQAIALTAYGTEQGYYGVGLYGYQDTLLAQQGKQVYAKSYIEGAADFIFGQQGEAFITNSDIRVSGKGSVTANGRDALTNPSYFVVSNSSIDKTTGSTAETGTVFLGRPWRKYARVAVQETYLGSIINSAGWSIWEGSSDGTEFVTYQEYRNKGPGAQGKRASFSKEIDSPVQISTVLGSNYTTWVDAAYL